MEIMETKQMWLPAGRHKYSAPTDNRSHMRDLAAKPPPNLIMFRRGFFEIKIVPFQVFPSSQVIEMVRFPVFPSSQVINIVRFPVFPGSQVIKMVRFPVFPGSQLIKMDRFPIFP